MRCSKTTALFCKFNYILTFNRPQRITGAETAGATGAPTKFALNKQKQDTKKNSKNKSSCC